MRGHYPGARRNVNGTEVNQAEQCPMNFSLSLTSGELIAGSQRQTEVYRTLLFQPAEQAMNDRLAVFFVDGFRERDVHRADFDAAGR